MILNNNKNGFSLVELTFALMITGMGILAIFHVFPSGLDAGKKAVADTRATEFAQSVFESYRAEIAKMSPKEWEENFNGDELKIPNFEIPAGDGSKLIKIPLVNSFQEPKDAIPFPEGSKPEEYIRYKLATELLPNSKNLVGIYLEVSYGKMSSHKRTFYTAIYYNSMER